jgi:hypothetical protein
MNSANIQPPNSSSRWDSALTATLVGAIVGALIGGVVSYGVSYITEDQNKQNVAQALYTDISTTSNVLNLSLINYNSFKVTNPSDVTIFISPAPFYTEHGLYYIYASDISKFDSDLSNEIFLYYYNVMIIENERQYIEDHFSEVMNPGNLTTEKEKEEQTFVTYSFALPEQINLTIQCGEIVKKKIKDKYKVVSYSTVLTEINATNSYSFFANHISFFANHTYW